MPGADLTADLALLRDAALAAGQIARRHFGNGPETWDKGDGQGPVTEADLEIDAMLKTDLCAARPDHGWMSEETADGPDRLSRDKVFIIDPIDGTRAFIDGSKSFSHSLAIVESGTPVAAAIHLPMLDLTYLAARGQGATLNGLPIAPTGRDDLKDATVLGAKSNFADERWKGGCPPVQRTFRSSLAYRLALVAEGRFDAMITLRMAWEWDIAAGALIVSEAGGRIANRWGEALLFNNPHPQLDGVVAGTPVVADALLHRIV
ncbi:myo-inositol-1(or 4)-monophosphatase [Jannaschia faecimaris]|uniref:Myo-inositol-1(Or 4)-monophosphatase n=1 Tax=Jannaschia faecimaris TaxID=1244108 RepID=A0A1H3IYI7_9RHOB|nr:3'(2'),5'-bisphosphate nucleotidase CysQ [Jannaschia faecimaris]SDY32359.1 myo-inositol-1(or 4)-monophosphatase [Jannaschia faecimaris]